MKTVVSDEGSVLAEAVNKGDIEVLRKTWPNKTNLVEIPVSLLDWIKNPVYDNELGEEILGDLMPSEIEVLLPQYLLLVHDREQGLVNILYFWFL